MLDKENIEALLLCAGANLRTDEDNIFFEAEDDTPAMAELKKAVTELKKKETSEALQRSASTILKIRMDAKKHIDGLVKRLREVKAVQESLRQRINDAAVAIAYGDKTMNWLPTCAVISGERLYKDDIDEIKQYFKIPETEYTKILAEIKAKRAKMKT